MKTNQTQKNIPSDWQQVKLGDICDFKKGKGLPKDDLIKDGKYEAIHYGELFTKYHEKIENILSKTNNNKNVFLSKKNDILMPTSDVTPRGLSTASFIDKDGVILGGDILVIRPKSNILNGLFFSNFVSSQKQEVIKLVSGTTVFHLYGSDMSKLKFNLPPLPEQNRIVSVLETWDKAIEKLAKKIELKKQIKKGLMQDLLTGRKRLRGFSDKWEIKKLGDICNLYQPQTITSEEISNIGKYKVYGANGVIGYYDKYNHENSEILITCRGATCGTINFSEPKSWVTGNAMVATPKNQLLNKEFLYYILIFSNLNSVITGLAQPQITRKDLSPFKVKIPELEEQSAIAQILTTADKEIIELEKKLQIIKEQKKFLLDNLITGKIRTPENLLNKVK